MLERLLRWAERWPDRTWAVEGATGLGHFLAQQLVARQETVLDVPATLAARARVLRSIAISRPYRRIIRAWPRTNEAVQVKFG